MPEKTKPDTTKQPPSTPKPGPDSFRESVKTGREVQPTQPHPPQPPDRNKR